MKAHALARLSAYSSQQLGLFTRAQAGEVGLNAGALQRLVQAGVTERIYPDVFRFAASTPTWHQRVLAACLDGGDECLASHRTAAALHRFDGFEPGGVIEVVVPMRRRHRRRDVIVHHSRSLTSVDRCDAGTIPCTSVARTLIDLGAVVPATAVEEALDAAERDRMLTRPQLRRRYSSLRAQGRNGIGAMTQILDHRDGLERTPRSVLERRMLRLLARAGLPTPTTRFRLQLGDGRIVELDFAFAPIPLALEVNGNWSHATPSARARDDDRANAIQNSGWELRQFTYEQVMHQPAKIARAVREALEIASKRV
jgi:very-short-patch-repair endonuclease